MTSQVYNRFYPFILIFTLLCSVTYAQKSNTLRNSDKQAKKFQTNTPHPVSLFICQSPSITNFSENRSYELGMKFKTSQNGIITGIKFWKADSESGLHTGKIWDANGNQLATVDFKNESGPGWQTQNLDQALTIAKNTVYIVSVNCNSHYVSTIQGLSSETKSCPLTTVADGNNGLYGDAGTLPTQSFNASNYFRDVIFYSTEPDACPPSTALPDTFIHRGYLGWINDLASSPRPNDNWPSIWINDELIQDYENTFDLMQRIGLNEISIWGLFAARAWPLDIEHAIDADRTKQVLKIIDAAHKHGIKVLSGLGVYCWGFDDIIRANPSLGCSNNFSIMCPNNPDAWNWQKRIIDYIFSFPVDGVSMQSADQGRCRDCKELDALSDVAYHAIINDRVAAYIKTNYPGKLVGVNTFGMSLSNPSDLKSVQKMCAHADYLIDVNNTALIPGNSYLCNLAQTIGPCSYGNLSSPGIEPPMHWERNRWFLPMVKRRSQTSKSLFSQGARAVENYMHLIKNPGEEVSLLLAATLEKNPSLKWETELKNILNEIYQPVDTFTLQYLSDLFIKAEDLYFEHAIGAGDIISLEPLVSGSSGPPVYIRDRMTPDAMKEYKKDLCVLRSIFETLKSKVNNNAKMDLIIKCIDGTINDINSLINSTTGCTIVFTKQANKSENEEKLRIGFSYLQKKGEFKVYVWNPKSSHFAEMRLWNYQGALVRTTQISLNQGNNEFNITEKGLASGFYFLEIRDPLFLKVEHIKLFID